MYANGWVFVFQVTINESIHFFHLLTTLLCIKYLVFASQKAPFLFAMLLWQHYDELYSM